MDSIPARVSDRIRTSLKQFQPILTSAKARDINESDTVVIVTDLLNAVFGYDKYSEITSEYFEQRQAMSRFTLGALLLSDAVVDVVRRELRRVAEVKVDAEEIRTLLQTEVLKREVIEGEKAALAAKQVSRGVKRMLRKLREDDEPEAKTPASPEAAA